jgi:hypothetical protein
LGYKGFGTTARLVMLPHESHGCAAKESVLHVLAEIFEGFDVHVKGRKWKEDISTTCVHKYVEK